ncbi:hypothetical protein BH18ACT7_BH18ACT7_13120 [soil metagenome]
MQPLRRAVATAALSVVVLGSLTADARAANPSAIDIGRAGSFAVLGATTVTSAGTSVIDAGIEKSVSFVTPADASTGAYGRTLTFTTAPPAA